MPRGEENQEVPQEEIRDRSEEIQEQDLEAQRSLEVVTEPESVIEYERSIEESEAIEAAVIEAVEAADLQERTAVTEEGKEQIPTSEQVVARPITLPSPPKTGEELVELDGKGTDLGSKDVDPQPPPELVEVEKEQVEGEDREQEMEDREAPEILDETSNKHMPVEDGEVILDEVSFKVESQVEDGEVILDDTSFKFFTPTPDQELRDRTAEEQAPSEVVSEEETGKILEPDAFKPVPAREVTEEIEHEDHWSEPVSEGGDPTEDTVGEFPEQTEAGQEEEGGSILIGNEGEEELEQIDLSAKSETEVEEYWEPPEMYIYTAEDGTITFVDAGGNPIKCPPQYFLDKASGADTAKAWYPGGKNVQTFDVPPFPGYKVDEFYVIEGKQDPWTGMTTYILVDRDGNPVKNQPEIEKDPNLGTFTYQGELPGIDIPVKLFSESQIYIYTAADGSKTLVDNDGNLLKCPPTISGDPEKGYYFKGPQGEKIKINDYSPPTTDIYVYTAPDGTKTIVDSDGNPINCPPPIYGDPEKGYSTPGSEGEKIPLAAYVPPVTEVYVYTAQDGTKTVVDKDGNLVKYPPQLIANPGGDGFIAQGPKGENIEVSAYQPQLTGIFVYTAQDGVKTVVDSGGNPIKCPPPLFSDPEKGSHTMGPEGQQVKIQDYIPPITDIYIYTAADGSRTVVDSYGDPVKSPPYIWNDPSGEGGTVITGPDGKPLLLQEYKPISSHWD